MASRNPQLGIRRLPSSSTSAARGATIPKPSVALWSAKPITSSVASAISLLAAAWPIARPSAKLCRPMPTAINSESRRAGDHAAMPRARRRLHEDGAGRRRRPRPPTRAGSSTRLASGSCGGAVHPLLVGHEAQETGAEARHEQEAVAERRVETAVAGVEVARAPRRSAPTPRRARPRRGTTGCRPRSRSASGGARGAGRFRRPIGSPMRIVTPAMKPSSSVFSRLMMQSSPEP